MPTKSPKITATVLPSLEKVFDDQRPESCLLAPRMSALRGETLSFQVAVSLSNCQTSMGITATLSAPPELPASMRRVVSVPVRCAAPLRHDGNYLRTAPGLYPDLLEPIADAPFKVQPDGYVSLWIDATVPDDCEHGVYRIAVTLSCQDALVNEPPPDVEAHMDVEVIHAALPAQSLLVTQWFHCDGLATYYGVDVFSGAHWALIEAQLETYVRGGGNVLYTPLFTPPLDTAVGHERLTVQLVDVSHQNGTYTFDFSKLQKWVQMGERHGIAVYEMSHLFSQWGATCAPKIVINGEKRFGWHTPADSAEYIDFLDQFLPALKAELHALCIEGRVLFHVSDEPTQAHMASYSKAAQILKAHLSEYPIMDALSDIAFYEQGLVTRPIPATDHIEPFLEANVPDLWTYHCVGQSVDVANRFMSMPSARQRILGVQLYKFGIAGFLQWGYNFYNAQYSYHAINPFLDTDAGGAFPAGDAFLVYPGADGKPMESIRYMVFREAMQDLRALLLLEELIGRDEVMLMVEEGLPEPITFRTYPASQIYLLDLRERVNRRILQCVWQQDVLDHLENLLK